VKKFLFLGVFSIAVFHLSLLAQEKIPIHATRITDPPKIDGRLDDECWKQGVIFSDFIEAAPAFGLPALNRTEVMVVYDNDAVYVSAKCYMDPDSIWMQLSKRDEIFDNTDALAFGFDTYHDGQNAFAFGVSPRNVQTDFKIFVNDEEDYAWDAVWDSRVYLANDGWYVEAKIPYAAFRFPKVTVQDWYIDFYRIVRSNRYEYHSAAVDPKREWTGFSISAAHRRNRYSATTSSFAVPLCNSLLQCLFRPCH
jgi:hypothetical protein